MKICEIFKSIQGEGRYIGYPCLFIRLSGCTRDCSFCDTKYHKKYKEITIQRIIDKIEKAKYNIIIWTGGEPLLQREDILLIIYKLNKKIKHHLETNGDLLKKEDIYNFDYISVSPKENIFKNKKWLLNFFSNIDIKVATDLDINRKLIKYADYLMPLEIGNKKEDLKTKQNVLNFCIEHGIKYSPRLQTEVIGLR